MAPTVVDANQTGFEAIGRPRQDSRAPEPCLIPSLNDEGVEDGQFDSLPIDYPQAEVDAFCLKHRFDIQYFLATIWSLVVYRFADAEQVLIGLCDSIDHDGNAMSKANMRVVTAPLNEKRPVKSLFRTAGWSLLSDPDGTSFNSALVFDAASRPERIECANGNGEKDQGDCDVVVLLTPYRKDGPLSLVYNTANFSSQHANSLASAVAHAVTSVLRNPDQIPADVPLFSQRHLDWVTALNSHHLVEPSSPYVCEMIHQNARQHPDKEAICAWDGTVTYSQLDHLSARLASNLENLGVQPAMMVGICFEKSLWAIVAMLAINKAGAAYVPLDPSQPRRRLEFITNKADIRLIVTSPQHSQFLPEITTVTVSEQTISQLQSASTTRRDPPRPDDPAYCLFTSGSTGQPKGCVVGHSALASVATHTGPLHIEAGSRVLQFASFSFGMALIEIWCALSKGATICMPSNHDRLNKLSEEMNTMRVNWALATPTVINSIHPRDVSYLQTLVIAGEPLRKEQIKLWSGTVHLCQAYGLTEWAGICTVSQRILSASEQNHIGMPSNSKLWLVDPSNHNKLAPVGSAAELVIEGPSLANGYLDEPEKTAAVFIYNPPWLSLFCPTRQKRRLYKTGDLVRYNSSGSISYIGRKDKQIKIRGHRVEVNEIEYLISKSSPHVEKVVVDLVTPADAGGQPKLTAFVQPTKDHSNGVNGADSSPSSCFLTADKSFISRADAIKVELSTQLPHYMIPEMFIPLKYVPVTLTGKIDRRNLQGWASDLSRGELSALCGVDRDVSPPRTKREYTLVRLVSSVLGLKSNRVGVNHSFFRLGGDSVIAMKLVKEARLEGFTLTVADTFKNPILSDLAEVMFPTSDQPEQAVPFQLVSSASWELASRAAVEQCRVRLDKIEDLYPCTALQEGLMALTGRSPNAYVGRFVYRLPIDTDLDRFMKAWEQVVAANPILRTRIIQLPTSAMLQVVIRDPLHWDAAKDADTYLRDIPQMRLGDVLSRAAIVKEGDGSGSSLFVATVHHALCDRWSLQLLLRHLEAAYNDLQPPSRPFSPFVLYTTQINGAEQFWRSQFENFNADIFPRLHSANHAPLPTAEVEQCMLLPDLSDNDFTMTTFVRLAWAIVISLYSNSSHAVFGVTSAGRSAPVPDIEEMTGPTIATLPFYVHLQPGQTVQDALSCVQNKSIEMIPFEQAGLQSIRKYSPETDAACQFQSLVVVQTARAKQSMLEMCQEGPAVQGGFGNYALELMCNLHDDTSNVSATASFDPNVISEEEVHSIVHTFQHVLGGLINYPRQRIDEISVLSPHDADLLRKLNSSSIPGGDRCVHDIIRENCLKWPNAPAVEGWDGTFTYSEIDDISSQLAAHLASRGVGPEPMGPQVMVPVLFEKSRWTTVVILAIMKAGGAFVLLDPSHPQSRLAEICQDVGARLIISSAMYTSRSAQLAEEVVVVGDNANSWQAHENWNAPAVYTDNALYVMFTSGSTGKPKGVVIEHSAWCVTAMEHISEFNLQPGVRMLQFSSFAFDATVTEVLSTLMAGACVCIIPEAVRTDPSLLTKSITHLNVSHAVLTPSLARLLTPSEVKGLRYLIIGGEQVTRADITWWKQSQVRLQSLYGPCECSVSTAITEPFHPSSVPSNIGRPKGSQGWVVDPQNHNTLLPVGAVGELIIEGPIVGRGYVNNSRATAGAFLLDTSSYPAWFRDMRPDGGKSKARMYKTGDLVRLNADGTLCFVGRKDTQVKLRGQRIELGEVENHIRTCFDDGSVTDVVADVIKPANSAGQRLMAFIWQERKQKGDGSAEVVESGAPFAKQTEEFRKSAAVAAAKLYDIVPRYMVPNVFIPLSQMPQTASGKIDRRYLRQSAEHLWQQLEEYRVTAVEKRAPSSWTEETLREIWSRVLNFTVTSIGVDDNFFHLGGDSITAMQVVAQAQDKQLHHSVEDIFRLKTIAQLAIHAASDHPASIDTKDDVNVPFQLSPIQRFYFDMMPRGHHCLNEQFLLCFTMTMVTESLHKALVSVVSRHPMLRARFSKDENGIWCQRVSDEANGSFRFQTHAVSSRQEMQEIMSVSQRLLDIEAGPVFSADTITYGDEQFLFLAAHYLVVDSQSWNVLLGCLEAALKESSPLTQPPNSFRTWCRLQPSYDQETEYLEPALPNREIRARDTDYWSISGKPNTFGDASRHAFSLDEQTTALLLDVANNAFRTKPVELLHAVLLHSFTRTFYERSSPVIFTECDVRPNCDSNIDFSQTVGPFGILCPIDVDLAPEDDIQMTVARVKDIRRRTYKNGCSKISSTRFNSQANRPVEMFFSLRGQGQHSGTSFETDDRMNFLHAAQDVVRFALFEVSAVVSQGRLRFSVMFNKHMRHQDRIHEWVQNFQVSLLTASQTLKASQPRYTLSDFPLLPLTYHGLESFFETALPEIGVCSNNVEDAYPCSPMQRGILLSQAKDPALYQVQFIWEVTNSAGSAITEELESAWRQVVARHAILRTVFVESSSAEGYDQVVLKIVSPKITKVKCTVSEDPISVLKKHCQNMLFSEPLSHCLTLCETSTGLFCRLDISHALMDAASMSVITRDFIAAYGGRLPAGQGPLYRDYISYVQSQSQDAALEYWKVYLESVQPCIFPATGSIRKHDRVFRTMSAELSSRADIDSYCKANDLTMSNLLCVAWAIVLQCFTGSSDVCFGYLTSGREIPVRGIQDIVGPFINMLVCRVNLENETAKSTIQKVQDDFLRSLPYQTFSLANINQAMGTAGQELFNTAISVDRPHKGEVSEPSGIGLKLVDRQDLAEYDIAMNVEASDDAVNLTMRYWTSCLTASQALSVAATFKKALGELIADDKVSPSSIDVFSQRDKDIVWNRNDKVPQAQSCCVHDIIHQRSLNRPQAPAVCAWDGNFTYQELDALSTRLALFLVNYGVGLEIFVPLCFEKSRWTTVAQVAVMKAGGTFVLLDPSYPQQRLQTLCESVNCKVIVSSRKNAELSSQLVGNVVVVGDYDTPWDDATAESTLPKVSPECPLYIVFTSGSTGKPKGVVIDHRSYATAALGYNVSQNVSFEARVLQFASYAFDVSIMESISTLMGGGCVCVLSESQRTDTFVQAVNVFKITHAFLTPSFVRSLGIEQSVASCFPTLRTLVLGGEPMSKRDIYQWKGHVQLINGYGPAECSVTASVQTDVVHDSLCNIGKPLGAVYWIVDPHNHNRLMPIGAVGELIIEGPIVGRGYLNDPEKTATSFIDCPSWLKDLRGSTSSSRLYKTGDLARYDADGSACYVGRVDTQVKLRGQRIELGEVENHVRNSFANVTDVVADILLPGGSGSPCLVAFIQHDSTGAVGERGTAINGETEKNIFGVTSATFRDAVARADRALRDTMPGVFVPALYVPVNQIPRTGTGKNDRKKLRDLFELLPGEELEEYRSATPKERLTPTTDSEQILQEVWAQVLGIPSAGIGKDDSFFEIGGDSIGAMRVVSMAREMGLHLTVAGFFDNPELSALALTGLSGVSASATQAESFSLTSVKDPVAFGSVLKSRGILQSQDNVDIIDVQPITESQLFFLNRRTIHHFTFELRGKVDLGRLRDAFGAVISKHSTLRTLFVDGVDDLPLAQVILGNATVPFQHVQTTQEFSQFCDSLFDEDRGSTIVFADLPFKFTLVSRSETDHALVTRLSHAQWDGVSIAGLFRDLVAAYNGDSLSPQKTFQDFTYFRSQQKTAAAFEFWRTYLDGSSVPKLSLTGNAACEAEAPEMIMEGRSIQPVPVPPTGITLGTVVKAAWALLLAETTRQTDLVFGQTVNGRSSPLAGIDDILGPLLNFIPFRVKLQPSWTVLDLLRHCQKQYTKTLHYDYLDCRDIIKKSTNWPAETQLPYIIQHQNFNRDLKLPLEGTEHQGFTLRNNFTPMREMFMFSSPEADRLDIEICASQNVMSAEDARTVQERFIPLVEVLTQSPHRSLHSLDGLEWLV